MRKWRFALFLAPVLGAAAIGLFADRYLSNNLQAAAQIDPQATATLPVSRVVLFNSGVGYFAREGKVQGDTRVDLTFLERDVNDLLKSMTLQDLDGGRITAVAYDSREPIDRTLSSFAINLSNNPTLGQILTQARGERVEVALQPTPQAQPGLLSGTIVGMETQKLPSGPNQTVEAQMLNLLTADGLRSIKMSEILRIKFTNPVLESELRRALEVVSLSHDSQKKAVSVQFAGDGERRVRIAYVTEAPIWKSTYRLALDKEGQPQLQGWAIVENTSDDDWANVRMALVAGRPISFKMDLYNPLYVPRPTVEPELFASLRPPAYQGGFGATPDALAGAGGGFKGVNQDRGFAPGRPKAADTPEADSAADGFARRNAANEQSNLRQAEEKQRKEFAKKLGAELAERMDFAAVQQAATASKLGDTFQYVIDHPVTLPRQKSALLPVISSAIEATRVSIYNPQVQAKHPLLGVRFKNTTGANLAQGPVTVFDGSTYAGDARILDIQPNEERLLAFAIDLGVEVDPQVGPSTSRVTAVKADKGVVVTTNKQVDERRYKIVNRSDSDRIVLIEHPNRTNQQFNLVETPKPVEETAELWRFQTPVAAGQTTTFVVKEEKQFGTRYELTNSGDNTIRFLLTLNEASDSLKAKLREALSLKAKWDEQRRELQQVVVDLQRLSQDQDRIRRNLRETPPAAEVYKVYLEKLSAQEKEIDALTAKQKSLMAAEFSAKKAYEDYLSTISD
jgi:hypothetical protein